MKIQAIMLILALFLCATTTFATEITNIAGKVYERVRVSRVEPDGITITHAGGVAKLFFTELPPDVQMKYNYNPEKAAAHAQTVSQAQRQYSQQNRAMPSQPTIGVAEPIRVFNIIAIKDKTVKSVSGITGLFTDSFGHVFARPVRGGLYRVTFDVRNATDRDINVKIIYGDYYKMIFIPAGRTKEREEISGREKYGEIFAEVDGKRKGYTFNW